ncbi:50S ribosomal protein L5 [Candidatus Gracilibacteria bacterium CG17_big_fil_post_rev_8_21_14_2_50_48_13]|nr:MAG: 50S ribosomal protein L5 [Candidatus Gracilibacteria bacterium CG17_big_fil_post_rev_8_21_14_2_50_48_13]
MAHQYITEYRDAIADNLMKSGAYKNKHAVPKLDKIIVSVGIGSYMQKSKDYSAIEKNLAQLTGQKPVMRKSKKAISNFKLREGMPVGLQVTLRGPRMYAFLSKLINVVLPRVRDFRGVSLRSFDGHGNYSLGLPEQTVFPEVRQDDGMLLHGVQVTFSTSATNNDDGLALLKAMAFPFQK